MEESILLRFYLKVGFCALAALILSIVMMMFLNAPQMILFGLAIALWYGYTAYSVYAKTKRGEIISVYAKCVDVEEQTWVEKRVKRNPLYRFIAMSSGADTESSVNALLNDDENEGEVSLFIRAPLRKFRPGELYCMLFRKTDDGQYTEQMLIASGVVPPNPMQFAASEEKMESVSAKMTDDFEDELEIEPDKLESTKTIRVDFQNK